MGVKEIDKEAGRSCPHLDDGAGCGIWGRHPPSCQAFTCLWRRSAALAPPALFPHACGFLLALGELSSWPTVVKLLPAPDRPIAWDTPANRGFVAFLAAKLNAAVVIMAPEGFGQIAFAPSGRVFQRELDPSVFPHGGRAIAVPESEYGPDRRAPAERLAELEAAPDLASP
jgi:hypothetical protein